ncbi:MAG: hypothetical protein RSC43_00315 [Clostridia bacterium]
MHSSSLVLSLSPIVSKSLFEIVCDEMGYEYRERDGLFGRAIPLSGDLAAFGRACYAIITVSPISEIIGSAKRSPFYDADKPTDFLTILKYYLYTPEFASDLNDIVAASKGVDINYKDKDMRRDAAIARNVLDVRLGDKLEVSDEVNAVFEQVYLKGCQLSADVNIFMLYSRVTSLRLGLRNSAISKRKEGTTINNRNLFQQNPELSIALDNDFWDWLRTKIAVDTERDDTIVMTKFMGAYLNRYFLPYWFSKCMPKHVNSSMGTLYKGEVLSQANLLTFPATQYVDVDIHAVLQRLYNISYRLFAHRRAYVKHATNETQYTILEYYVTKLLSKQIESISAVATKLLKRSHVNIFTLDTNYNTGRIVNGSGSADNSFVKRIQMNVALVAKIDETRGSMSIATMTDVYKSLALASLASSDSTSSNYPYIAAEYINTSGASADYVYTSIGEIVQCLCDLDNLNMVLHNYGLSVIDLFSMGNLNVTFIDNITNIDSLVTAIRTQAIKDPIDFDDGIQTQGIFRGRQWFELQDYLPNLFKKSGDNSFHKLSDVVAGIPSVKQQHKQLVGESFIHDTMVCVNNVKPLEVTPGAMQLSNLLTQMTPGQFNLLDSQLEYHLNPEEYHLVDDDGCVMHKELTDKYHGEAPFYIYMSLASLYADQTRNPFARMVGARYVLAYNSGPFTRLFGDYIYGQMYTRLVKYLDSSIKASIPISKRNTSLAEDANHPSIGESGEALLAQRESQDVIEEWMDTREARVNDTIQYSKASGFLSDFRKLQYDDLPGMLFPTVISATYEVGVMGLSKYITGRQEAAKLFDAGVSDYGIPMNITFDSVERHFLIQPMGHDGNVHVFEQGKHLTSEQTQAVFNTPEFAMYMFNILSQDTRGAGPYYPLFAPAYDMIRGIYLYATVLLTKLFGTEAPEYYYIMESIQSVTDFLMTYLLVSSSLHVKLNEYFEGSQGISHFIELAKPRYSQSVRGTDDKSNYFIELGVCLLNMKTKMDTFQEFRTGLLSIGQYKGTGKLSNVICMLYDNGISVYRNTTMLCSEQSEVYTTMQTDILVAIVMNTLNVEVGTWAQLSNKLSSEYHAIRNYVEKSTGLSAIQSSTQKTEQDIYVLYRDALLKALHSEEYLQQTLCIATTIRTIDFENFQEGKLVCNDGFMLYDNGKHYYKEKEGNVVVFVHRDGLLFYVSLSTDHVDIRPFDISKLED